MPCTCRVHMLLVKQVLKSARTRRITLIVVPMAREFLKGLNNGYADAEKTQPEVKNEVKNVDCLGALEAVYQCHGQLWTSDGLRHWRDVVNVRVEPQGMYSPSGTKDRRKVEGERERHTVHEAQEENYSAKPPAEKNWYNADCMGLRNLAGGIEWVKQARSSNPSKQSLNIRQRAKTERMWTTPGHLVRRLNCSSPEMNIDEMNEEEGWRGEAAKVASEDSSIMP
ncbi:hypothetical protein BT96DRAFT_949479 [Gymnopus androsaceus JB14]|uniref:Uncharacterized protein n=1 Tax=Gymnopus androsaceus JB14 TaxID=1447944 RepID=A0A6A4GKK3_9AGAR|nr:hypothetical protein BT96DRAFT_949479 [Gymnopus androsaceus JB14]